MAHSAIMSVRITGNSDDAVKAFQKATSKAAAFGSFMGGAALKGVTALWNKLSGLGSAVMDMSDSTDLRRLMADYQQTTADLNALKARKEELQDCILPYIGDHEGVRCGNMQATYKHSTRKGYTRVVQPWEGRTFRFSEIKPKKTK